jgi:hypothetical protein
LLFFLLSLPVWIGDHALAFMSRTTLSHTLQPSTTYPEPSTS